MGDILVVCTQMLVGMYIFELIYRVRIRYVVSFYGSFPVKGALLIFERIAYTKAAAQSYMKKGLDETDAD